MRTRRDLLGDLRTSETFGNDHRDLHTRSRLFGDTARPLISESQQGQEVGEIHESFGFALLGASKELSVILLVQQHMEALLYAIRQLKLRQISGDLDFVPNGRAACDAYIRSFGRFAMSG